MRYTVPGFSAIVVAPRLVVPLRSLTLPLVSIVIAPTVVPLVSNPYQSHLSPRYCANPYIKRDEDLICGAEVLPPIGRARSNRSGVGSL